MRFLSEYEHTHGTESKLGILLINLGTPDAPTPKALRPYLKSFLSDPRVVEIPRVIWWFILNGIILNTRPKKSAEKYAQIWSADGSPLLVHTAKQAKLLEGYLREHVHTPYVVEYAMRYGTPAIDEAMARLRRQHCDRLLVLPLYPQYAASSSATALDAVFSVLQKTRNMPAVRTVKHFHDDERYIAALRDQVRAHWTRHGRPSVLVMSFHGVPRYTLDKGDPYHCECMKTGRLLAEQLGLEKDQYRVTFQSRFGRAEWLKPYTAPTLTELGKARTRRVDVICPGFVSDCLETLEEIALEGKSAFLNAGGQEFHYIPCLNEQDAWMHALTGIVVDHLGTWVGVPREAQTVQSEARASRQRALDMGARK